MHRRSTLALLPSAPRVSAPPPPLCYREPRNTRGKAQQSLIFKILTAISFPQHYLTWLSRSSIQHTEGWCGNLRPEDGGRRTSCNFNVVIGLLLQKSCQQSFPLPLLTLFCLVLFPFCETWIVNSHPPQPFPTKNAAPCSQPPLPPHTHPISIISPPFLSSSTSDPSHPSISQIQPSLTCSLISRHSIPIMQIATGKLFS